MLEKFIEIGVVAKPHGVRGAVKVRLYNPGSDALQRSEQVVIDGRPVAARQVGRSGADAVVLKLSNVDGRDRAEALRGAVVSIARDALGELSDDEFYLDDLVGCRVVDQGGEDLGAVARVDDFGAAGVLVIRGHGRELMIPLVDPWVDEVDTDARQIKVSDMGQWLELAVKV